MWHSFSVSHVPCSPVTLTAWDLYCVRMSEIQVWRIWVLRLIITVTGTEGFIRVAYFQPDSTNVSNRPGIFWLAQACEEYWLRFLSVSQRFDTFCLLFSFCPPPPPSRPTPPSPPTAISKKRATTINHNITDPGSGARGGGGGGGVVVVVVVVVVLLCRPCENSQEIT